MNTAPPTPKGFRDIDPALAAKRRRVVAKIEEVLVKNGFVPIETPTVEYSETLTGKYGEEERLIYQFKDRAGRNLALRYDLTVPLARYVAAYRPTLPFRRYQIGQVFRGENPQRGRWREFTQLDFDSVGSSEIEEDANIIKSAIDSARSLGLKEFQMKINFVPNIEKIKSLIGINPETSQIVVREMDKVGKKPEAEINKAIAYLGNSLVSAATISGTISSFEQYAKPGTAAEIASQFEGFQPPPNYPFDVSKVAIEKQLQEARQNPRLKEIFQEPEEFKKLKGILLESGVKENEFKFERQLVRGLNYYTGFIFELKPSERLEDLTLGSGGRYDNLIGMFFYPDKGRAKEQIPAVGFSFGLDRLVEIVPD